MIWLFLSNIWKIGQIFIPSSGHTGGEVGGRNDPPVPKEVVKKVVHKVVVVVWEVLQWKEAEDGEAFLVVTTGQKVTKLMINLTQEGNKKWMATFWVSHMQGMNGPHRMQYTHMENNFAVQVLCSCNRASQNYFF